MDDISETSNSGAMESAPTHCFLAALLAGAVAGVALALNH
jgi:hypothetical protein